MPLSQQLRRDFLAYFKNRGHTVVPSSPVVPHEDPSLLFTNAGMNQFKDVFLGESTRDYARAATSQKCIRAGGKHNDLENVGHTSRHLTFFEMLGNFSFGDYFKKEAIAFAWEVATTVYGFEEEKIWPTIYKDDDEAFELWKKYVPEKRITRFGDEDNFWAMGETGPCGPCSELFYDQGPDFGAANTLREDPENHRFLEFWNLVFMQYNRDSSQRMTPLPKASIDTGSGLERVAALKIGARSVFETDILRELIAGVEQTSGIAYVINGHNAPAFHVIADHLRSLAFAIADGVQPSNIDRGYVLRKILRRAVRYGRTLGFEEPFLAKILPRLISMMGNDYRELHVAKDRIAEILTLEEEAFFRTLRRGGNLLAQVIQDAKAQTQCIQGDDAFRLKDTYGLPFEEIALIAKDAGLKVDVKRFEALEDEARQRSKQAHKTVQQVAGENLFTNIKESLFLGYDHTESESEIIALVKDGAFVETLDAGQEGQVVLDKTPFYAEKGGQVGDTGRLHTADCAFTVRDCQMPYSGISVHLGIVAKGTLHVGQRLKATVDAARRQLIANNHTATHLLHWALHEVLGEHIKQAGSVVDEARLRFDFSHHKPLSETELYTIEDLVNHKVRENKPVHWYEISFAEAQKAKEIKQFFGEKYGNKVRVVDIEFSKELCGGTHARHIGTIGYFRIVKEGSIAAGVRRIEAVTGNAAEKYARDQEATLKETASLIKAPTAEVLPRLHKMLEEMRDLDKTVKQLKKAENVQLAKTLIQKGKEHNGVVILCEQIDCEPAQLKDLADLILQNARSLVLVLGSRFEDKGTLLCRITADVIAKGIKAGELIKTIAPIIEGSGGGRPDSAQAGGKAPEKIPEALQLARQKVMEQC